MNDEPSLFPRRGWRMWAAAFGGGALLVAAIGTFVAMIAAPDTRLAAEDRRADRAGAVLSSLLQKATAGRAASGEWAPASIEPTAQDAHAYRAAVVGSALVIVARGNLDADPQEDDWQVSSSDPMPLHVYDDARNLWVDSAMPAVFEMPMDGMNPDVPAADRLRIPATIRAFRKSRQARVVLEDLSAGEARYRREQKQWLLFDTLTPEVWHALGESTSGRMSFAVRAVTSGTSLVLSAIGDVDGDPCLDVWATRPGDLAPVHLQDDVVMDVCH